MKVSYIRQRFNRALEKKFLPEVFANRDFFEGVR